MVADLGWVDLDLGTLAGGPLLYLPTAQAKWRNIPNKSQPNLGLQPLIQIKHYLGQLRRRHRFNV